MAVWVDPEIRFESRLRTIAAAGIDVPADVAALRQRFTDLRGMTGTPVRDRLIAAIVTGDQTADLPALWALALAEAPGPDARDLVLREVRTAVNDAAREAYNRVALDNYGTLAAKWDKTVADLGAACKAGDPEADPASIISASDKVRKAWTDAAELAASLTRQLPGLRAAAELAGMFGDDDEYQAASTREREGYWLALVVDTTGQDRRALWSAWYLDERQDESERQAASAMTAASVPMTRLRRWGALLALGAVVRAHPPEPVQPYSYRDPEPVVENVELFTDPAPADDGPPAFVAVRLR